MKYQPTRQYLAHQDIGGGMQSDELWSTPLFMSFVQLREASIPREEIDKIVLSAMKGLGWDFTMRDLAIKTVFTANQLFPEGIHAQVFQSNFKKFEILNKDVIVK